MIDQFRAQPFDAAIPNAISNIYEQKCFLIWTILNDEVVDIDDDYQNDDGKL